MDAADLRDDRAAELAAGLDDVEQAAGGDFGKQFFHRVGVGAEVDDVVIGGVGSPAILSAVVKVVFLGLPGRLQTRLLSTSLSPTTSIWPPSLRVCRCFST